MRSDEIAPFGKRVELCRPCSLLRTQTMFVAARRERIVSVFIMATTARLDNAVRRCPLQTFTETISRLRLGRIFVTYILSTAYAADRDSFARIDSITRPTASNRRSLCSGPSISRPSACPCGVNPIGMVSPGKPTLLAGSVFLRYA